MAESVVIPPAYTGPPDSGHGGYCCGAFAALVDAEAADVSLRAPVPLGRELAVERSDGGVAVRDGDTLVAEARPGRLELDVPEPIGLEEAVAGNAAGHRLWAATHPFPTCFVCGPAREEAGDGFGVMAGPVPGRELFAADWTPGEDVADADGAVRPEFVWSVLDCPSSGPAANANGDPPIVLARFTAALDAPVRVGEPHVLFAWPLELDGRKRHTGVALLDAGGALLARARALWIELRR